MIHDYSNSLFCIIGKPHHGKTRVAEAIAQALGFKQGSASDIIYEALASQYAHATGNTVADCFTMLKKMPKETIRAELVRVGDDLTRNDPGALVTALVQRGCRVIDGIRRCVEIKAARGIFGMETNVWWVMRHPEPPPIADNTEVTIDDSDFVILNQYPDVSKLRAAVVQILLG